MNINDLFEIEPEIKNKRGKNNKDINVPFKATLLRLASFPGNKQKPSNNRGGRHDRGGLSRFVKQSGNFARRVVIKGHYIKMTEYGKKAASLHVDYIEREGVEKNGNKGIFYGEDNFERDNFFKEIKNESHQFRFIISPEDAHDLNLTDYTKQLMSEMQLDIGHNIQWAAVNHYNTDDPHTHVVIRGIDNEGKTLFIDRNYISSGFRNRAIKIATNELGLRNEYDLDKQINKEISQERFTYLDNKILQLTNSDNHIDIGNYPESKHERIKRGNLLARLDNLEKIGVAVKINHKEYYLKKGWDTSLKEISKRNDIIKTMYQAIGNKSHKYNIYSVDTIPKNVEGKLIKKIITDYDRYSFIIETVTGEANHVQINEIKDFEKYKEGDVIKISVNHDKWLKSSDINISEQVKTNKVYNADQHEKSINSPTVQLKNGRTVKTKEFVKAHIQRLKTLSRMGLSQLNKDGTWNVSDNFIEELKQKDIEAPIRKINISRETNLNIRDQINYKGRTWLDRFTASDLSHLSKSGFGADIKKLSKYRAQFLISLNIDPQSQNRAKLLDNIEKKDLVKSIQEQTAHKFNEARAIIGRIEKIELDSGKKYAKVVNELSREFSLIPWKDNYERMREALIKFDKGKAYIVKFERGIGK